MNQNTKNPNAPSSTPKIVIIIVIIISIILPILAFRLIIFISASFLESVFSKPEVKYNSHDFMKEYMLEHYNDTCTRYTPGITYETIYHNRYDFKWQIECSKTGDEKIQFNVTDLQVDEKRVVEENYLEVLHKYNIKQEEQSQFQP